MWHHERSPGICLCDTCLLWYHVCVAFRGFINSKEQQTEHRVQQHSIYSTVGKSIAIMFTEAITSMFTKTSVFTVSTYYNITIKQSANKGVNYNKFLNSNLQDSIYSVCIMSQCGY